MTTLRQHEFRQDFEICAEDGRVIGFLWRFDGFWHVCIDPFPAEHFSTHGEAERAAHRLAARAQEVAA